MLACLCLQPYKAIPYNKHLVRSINRVQELGSWPWAAGGGAVQEPRALVVLGDMTEFYREDEVDAFRAFYDPSVDAPPATDATRNSSSAASSSAGSTSRAQEEARGAATSPQVELPTWLMFGNHDYVINVNDCAGHFKSVDRNVCARSAVDQMRSVLTPGCDEHTWGNFPRGNVTSFDADSMAYSFDYNQWHFVVLQYSPRCGQDGGQGGWRQACLQAVAWRQDGVVQPTNLRRQAAAWFFQACGTAC